MPTGSYCQVCGKAAARGGVKGRCVSHGGGEQCGEPGCEKLAARGG